MTRSIARTARQVLNDGDDSAIQDVHRLFSSEVNHDVQDCESSRESPCERSNECNVHCESSAVNVESVMSSQSPDEFIAIQQNDESLKYLFDHVECEPFPLNCSYFYMKNGILMRHGVKSNHNVTYDQLVVTKPMRNKLLCLCFGLLGYHA